MEKNVYSPEDLAQEWKVSLLTIYKLLNRNKIPHFRVGRAYRIPQKYLESYMRREGNLALFEKEPPFVFPGEIQILLSLLKKEPKKMKDRVLEIRLFGSHARGQAHSDSDIDVLMIVKKLDSKTDRWIASLSEKAMAAADYSQLISILRMSKKHWERHQKLNSPLYEEIKRDGKKLWPNLKSSNPIASGPGTT